MKKNEEAWAYFEPIGSDKEKVQRVGLVMNSQKGTLLTATGLPRETDSLFERNKVLEHFKNARFSVKPALVTGLHNHSDIVIYDDATLGISMSVNRSSQVVSAISLWSIKNC